MDTAPITLMKESTFSHPSTRYPEALTCHALWVSLLLKMIGCQAGRLGLCDVRSFKYTQKLLRLQVAATHSVVRPRSRLNLGLKFTIRSGSDTQLRPLYLPTRSSEATAGLFTILQTRLKQS